jgi:DNA-binding HxlR family transcriptional regulator
MEVLGERWTLLIVRELLVGATTFTEICHGLPRIPRATLSARLTSLKAAGVVDLRGGAYRLTEAGVALAPVLRELARWATDTESAALTAEHIDTAALTWDMQRRIDTSMLPDRAVVLEIEFADRHSGDRQFWLHLARSGVNLCRIDTGAPIDLWLSAPAQALTRWWLGHLSWRDLLRRPDVDLQGDRALRRQMDQWFLRYVFTPDALGSKAG